MGTNCISIKPSRNAMFKFRGYFNDGSPVNNILSILPPIGVFWDIENCQVPKGRSKFFFGFVRSSAQLQNNNPVEVLVSNLPLGYDPAKICNKLKRLSENCGSRVGIITDQTTTIRFSSMEFASRAQKRMNKERVFGNCVFVSTPYNVTKDQDLNKFSARKPNICRNLDHNGLPNTRMYHCPNNENFLSAAPDYLINDHKNFMPYNKPAMYYQNGATFHCRTKQRGGNANGYNVPHTNQENIANHNNLPPWWHWNASNTNKNPMDRTNKTGRQVLAV